MTLHMSDYWIICREAIIRNDIDKFKFNLRFMDVDETNKKRQTLLHIACIYMNIKAISHLLNVSADPNIVNVYGFKPSGYLDENKYPDIVRLFQEV